MQQNILSPGLIVYKGTALAPRIWQRKRRNQGNKVEPHLYNSKGGLRENKMIDPEKHTERGRYSEGVRDETDSNCHETILGVNSNWLRKSLYTFVGVNRNKCTLEKFAGKISDMFRKFASVGASSNTFTKSL